MYINLKQRDKPLPSTHHHHSDFKSSTILVYMILMAKGHLTGCGVQRVNPILFSFSSCVLLLFVLSLISAVVSEYNRVDLSIGGLHRV